MPLRRRHAGAGGRRDLYRLNGFGRHGRLTVTGSRLRSESESESSSESTENLNFSSEHVRILLAGSTVTITQPTAAVVNIIAIRVLHLRVFCHSGPGPASLCFRNCHVHSHGQIS